MIWHGPDSFAVVELPFELRHRLPDQDVRTRRLAQLDRWWELVMSMLPSFLLLTGAAGLALICWATGWRSSGLALTAMILALLAVLWITVFMVLGIVTALVRGWRSVELTDDSAVPATGPLLGRHWSVPICHVPPDSEIDCLVRSVNQVVRELDDRLPGRIREPGSELVLWVLDGVTDQNVERRLLQWHEGLELVGTRPRLLAIGDARLRLPDKEPAGPAKGITLFLIALAIVTLFNANYISGREAAACRDGADCDGAGLTTFGKALSWLLNQLLFLGDSGELSPVLTQLRVFGWLTRILGLVTIGCIVVAIQRHLRFQRAGEVRVRQGLERDRDGKNPTIGIVTALPEEFAAVHALLENPREDLRDGDRSPYVLGDLPSRTDGTPHAVVLTLMLDAGNALAAAAGTHLSRSFPSVNCVVMTGIAAGVPTPESPQTHVRQGDIVVSTWGVVPYDHVDDTIDGTKLRAGVPQPSTLLTSAARLLQVKEIRGLQPWLTWLDISDRPDLATFARPPEETDTLWARDGSGPVPHPDPALSGHVPGVPKVHYGRIGSADRSLRNPTSRDSVAAEHTLRALEMEGKGIAYSTALNGLEWLVVRGISDYGDAHVNPTWRRYAALAAAAYVRALLAESPPLTVRGGHVRGRGH